MISLLLMFAAVHGADPATEIRAQRAASNAAVAAHDYERMRSFFAPDYTILPGSLGKPLDVEGFARRLGATFKDPTFVTYVRTPRTVTASANAKRAAESGTWVGTWRKPDGLMKLTGVYQATWVPRDGRWVLLNEAFVSLRCAGSKACSEVD